MASDLFYEASLRSKLTFKLKKFLKALFFGEVSQMQKDK